MKTEKSTRPPGQPRPRLPGLGLGIGLCVVVLLGCKDSKPQRADDFLLHADGKKIELPAEQQNALKESLFALACGGNSAALSSLQSTLSQYAVTGEKIEISIKKQVPESATTSHKNGADKPSVLNPAQYRIMIRLEGDKRDVSCLESIAN